MIYPMGTIETSIIKCEDGICIMRAEVMIKEDDTMRLLGTGTAYEKENSSFINKTSYIENCETSAVGRALGMAGFGIDTSVASFEEVANAIQQQEAKQKIDLKYETILREIIKNRNISNETVIKTLVKYGYTKLNEIELINYKKICDELKGEQ